MRKKENRVSKRVSIQESPSSSQPPVKPLLLAKPPAKRSILGSLNSINQSLLQQSSIISNYLQQQSQLKPVSSSPPVPSFLTQLNQQPNHGRSSIRRLIYKKDIYLQIDRLQQQQAQTRQQILRFRKQTQEKFKLKQAEIYKLREEIEFSYNSNSYFGESVLEKRHRNQVEELEKQLYELEKEIHCVSVDQNQLVVEKQIEIERLREEIEGMKGDNFEYAMAGEILGQRISEEQEKREELMGMLRDAQSSINDIQNQIDQINTQREASILLAQLSMLKSEINPRDEEAQHERLNELERIHNKLERNVEDNREYYEQELDDMRRGYEEQLGSLRSILQRRGEKRQKTSRSERWVNCLEDEMIELCDDECGSGGDIVGFSGSVWRRISARSGDGIGMREQQEMGMGIVEVIEEENEENLIESIIQKKEDRIKIDEIIELQKSQHKQEQVQNISSASESSLISSNEELKTSIEQTLNTKSRFTKNWLMMGSSFAVVAGLIAVYILKNR